MERLKGTTNEQFAPRWREMRRACGTLDQRFGIAAYTPVPRQWVRIDHQRGGEKIVGNHKKCTALQVVVNRAHPDQDHQSVDAQHQVRSAPRLQDHWISRR